MAAVRPCAAGATAWRGSLPLALLLLWVQLLLAPVSAVLPTAELLVDSTPARSYLAAVGAFSAPLPQATGMARQQWTPMVLPSGSRDACDGPVSVQVSPPFILVVERGTCSFDTKAAAAAEAGASAMVVVNTLEAVYAGRDYGDDRTDYECANGEGWLQEVASPAWSADNVAPSCSSDPRCVSSRCIVTNTTDSVKGTKVCCAWDLFLTMGSSTNETSLLPEVQAVFMTMAEGDLLLTNTALLAGQGDLQGSVYLRPEPYINLSSFLLWGLGVATAVYASWSAAAELRPQPKRAGAAAHAHSGDAPHGAPSDDMGAVDLTLAHTVGFVAFASAMLLVLFFFDVSLAVTALYCISAGSAAAAVAVAPLLRRARRHLLSSSSGGRSPAAEQPERVLSLGPLGEATVVDALALAVAWGMALWWALIRDVAPYDWLLQDFFGCSLCVVFLASLRLPSLRIAAVLLSLAFFYDIFWVFLSPLLFSESVMVAVATGGAATTDPETCEKYPMTDGCTVHSLPMLLKLPRIGDYQGGAVMLGLGDIVLPGLLLAFAARYDAAVGLPACRGYFPYVAGGYAAGLMMANLAVAMTGMGQPALLYLVPCTLGLMCFIAWADGTLRELWRGPAVLLGGGEGGGGTKREDADPRAALLYNL